MDPSYTPPPLSIPSLQPPPPPAAYQWKLNPGRRKTKRISCSCGALLRATAANTHRKEGQPFVFLLCARDQIERGRIHERLTGNEEREWKKFANFESPKNQWKRQLASNSLSRLRHVPGKNTWEVLGGSICSLRSRSQLFDVSDT